MASQYAAVELNILNFLQLFTQSGATTIISNA